MLPLCQEHPKPLCRLFLGLERLKNGHVRPPYPFLYYLSSKFTKIEKHVMLFLLFHICEAINWHVFDTGFVISDIKCRTNNQTPMPKVLPLYLFMWRLMWARVWHRGYMPIHTPPLALCRGMCPRAGLCTSPPAPIPLLTVPWHQMELGARANLPLLSLYTMVTLHVISSRLGPCAPPPLINTKTLLL